MGRLAPSPRVQRFVQKIGNIAFASGAFNKVNVPQSDYTLGFNLISTGLQVVVGATAPVIAGYGAFGPLSLVQVNTNGNRRPVSASGFVLDVADRVRNSPYNSPLTASPIATNTTNAWADHLHVPLTISEDTENGAWYTADTQLQMTIGVQCATTATVFSTVNGATIAGSWDVYAEKFQAPPPDRPGGWIEAISYYHELSYQGSLQLKNGTTSFDLNRDADYERIFLVFYTGSDADGTFAPADGLYTSVDLVINDKIHIFDNIAEAEVRFEQARTNDLVLPPGIATLDFARLKSDTGMSLRDILPTDSTMVSHLRLNVNSMSTSNNVDIITETVTDNAFAARWIVQAQANAGKAA